MYQDISAKFIEFENIFLGCGENKDERTLNCLNQVIEMADEILELIEHHELGNTGIIQSQTFLYLALALNRRGNLYWFRGFVQELDSQVSCQKAIHDFDRAEKLSKEWDLSINISPKSRCQCYLKLRLFDKAIAEAQQLCDSRKNSDSFLLLADVFNALGDYENALKVATEAVKYARNNVEHYETLSQRASIYNILGRKELAEIDLKNAAQFKQQIPI